MYEYFMYINLWMYMYVYCVLHRYPGIILVYLGFFCTRYCFFCTLCVWYVVPRAHMHRIVHRYKHFYYLVSNCVCYTHTYLLQSSKFVIDRIFFVTIWFFAKKCQASTRSHRNTQWIRKAVVTEKRQPIAGKLLVIQPKKKHTYNIEKHQTILTRHCPL